VINLEETVVRKLKTTQQILCTVESCTGGMIAHLVTTIAGASEIFWGGWVVYDNSAKEDLGVPKTLIENHGAVSSEVAQALAENGLRKMQTNSARTESRSLLKPRGLICVSTTGIAGPSGGTPEKPVGLCYIGVAVSGKGTHVEKLLIDAPSDRIQTKTFFAHRALELIREII